MTTDRNGKHIPVSYCSCGSRPKGNGGHAAHRKMHQRTADGHRPVTRDVFDLCMSDKALRMACTCGEGDKLGREHRAQPPCPTYVRWQRINGPQICTTCQGPVDEDGECRCEECRTCLGSGHVRDGETRTLRKCLDCCGAGMHVTGPAAL